MKKFRNRVLGLVMFVVMTITLTGCFGSFALTRAVYNLNDSVADDSTKGKIVKSIVTWVFVILPVYSLAGLADFFVLNLIEFWTDEEFHLSKSIEDNGMRLAMEPISENEMMIRYERDGQVLAEHRAVRISSEVMEIRDLQGRVAGRMVRAGDDMIELQDGQGRVIRTVEASMLPVS